MTYDFSPQDRHDVERLERLACQLDSLFKIPGTSISIGLENILSLVPVVGDALALVPSTIILHGAHKLGARPITLARMIRNLILDFGIGVVPLVGDVFDIAFNANLRNVALLKADLAKRYHAAEALYPTALLEK